MPPFPIDCHICQHSILIIPAIDNVFCVYTDSLSARVGGLLCVCRDKKWMLCAYYSRQLQPRETRYSSTEMEALAMLSAIEHFDHYLIGTHFTAYTDHQALLSLFKSTTLKNLLWRWRSHQSNFTFQIVQEGEMWWNPPHFPKDKHS